MVSNSVYVAIIFKPEEMGGGCSIPSSRTTLTIGKSITCIKNLHPGASEPYEYVNILRIISTKKNQK